VVVGVVRSARAGAVRVNGGGDPLTGGTFEVVYGDTYESSSVAGGGGIPTVNWTLGSSDDVAELLIELEQYRRRFGPL
jgi:hypothetical protein